MPAMHVLGDFRQAPQHPAQPHHSARHPGAHRGVQLQDHALVGLVPGNKGCWPTLAAAQAEPLRVPLAACVCVLHTEGGAQGEGQQRLLVSRPLRACACMCMRVCACPAHRGQRARSGPRGKLQHSACMGRAIPAVPLAHPAAAAAALPPASPCQPPNVKSAPSPRPRSMHACTQGT